MTHNLSSLGGEVQMSWCPGRKTGKQVNTVLWAVV